jgi:hypothetical protein
MSAHINLPSASDIAAVFEQECRERGAAGVDCYQNDGRLIARAVFGPARAVRPGDEIRGGVAIRVEGAEVVVHPFTWRQVCTNGAIAPLVHGSHRIERLEVDVATVSAAFTGAVVEELRSAIAICADPALLGETVDSMRSATDADGALAITVLTHLLHAVNEPQRQMLTAILDRHAAGGDPSAYGLFNAVTSLGRDTSEPDLRWRLELLGGRFLQSAVTRAMYTPQPLSALVPA